MDKVEAKRIATAAVEKMEIYPGTGCPGRCACHCCREYRRAVRVVQQVVLDALRESR